MPQQSIQVLLVDDHAVVRAGYARLLKLAGDIEVAGEAESGEAAYGLCRDQNFDVIVMDLSLPGMSGIETTRRICSRHPGTRVLVFSVHEEAIFVRRALAAGATGYIGKRAVADVLIEGVRQVARGRQYLDPSLADESGASEHDPATPLACLSSREFEIFRLLASGASVNAIAEELFVSPKTVANHASRLRAKLGVGGTADLTRLAIRTGVVGL
ncbi:LuxR family transcriptional regulator [Salinisphaera shabanensis T35B1]|jgi:DNA-binding NarL/FixJ family response regulator|uniref:response regulator transcription factor n=1 Tax=Salinisphaera shabanensis TaxID=180542 RepID=UPI00333F0C06|tara:strand:+ start:297 stop:938 length:642 start_codon:yes stop_codon:yes gene_type:complete